SEDSKLYDKIYWLQEDKKCLRPMLAPNLYRELKHFLRISNDPVVRIFELGACFRKEDSKNHLNEFKMLNAVEMGEISDTEKRLRELIKGIFASLVDYEIIEEDSVVYGKTIDVEVKGEEIASCATGPLPMDSNWGIDEDWVGIGIGMERLTKLVNNDPSAKAYGKNFTYQDGIRLDIK
ncbi:hypothetical protein AKJ49_00405, partial [candidate division MSBL1 archaeon SCGC-AAA382A03]